ncbi:uncharacterized protein [Diadema setosum]|uniref:uncharacterized protein n=1 Tax=Diadema setosum TaxID=31175 RepID=UPI003B3AAB7F
MESEEDVHVCLRCNTQIKGLMSYVEHRQSKCSVLCSPRAPGKGGGDEESSGQRKGEDEEQNTEERDDTQPSFTSRAASSPPHNQHRRRGRKRKLSIPQSSPKLDSAKKRLRGLTNKEDEVDIQGSPRRSSRRGIRISYTDLLSGIDRSDSKMDVEVKRERVDKKSADSASPRKRNRTDTVAKASENDSLQGKNKIRRKDAGDAKKGSVLKIKVVGGSQVGRRGRRKKNGQVMSNKKKAKQQKQKAVKPGKKLKLRARKGKGESDAETEEDEQSSDVSEGDSHDGQEDTLVYIKDGKFYCHICHIYCLTKKKIEIHCATRKHKKRAKEGHTVLAERRIKEDPAELQQTKMYHCAPCGYETKNLKMLNRHLRSIIHAQKAKIELHACKKCPRKYKTAEELDTHSKEHKAAMCRKCKQEFETEDLLNEHIAAENHLVEFRCTECDKTFSTKGNLVSHQRSHDPDKQFKCELCDYKCPQMADMRKHMYRHQGLKPFKCTLCEFESLTKNGVDRHMRTHMQRTRSFKCEECGAGFFDNLLLKQHIYMKHNPERRYPCTFEGCTFAFKYRSSLITHQRMHTQEKPYLCSQCGYATSTKYSLTKHIRLHTGEKPFKCSYPNCNYRARLSTHLTRHKIIHTGEKPFKCPLCPYQCNNKQNLRKHILTTKLHEGVQMYKCRACADFSSNSFREYVIHVRKQHANDKEYISFFEVAESVNKRRDGPQEYEICEEEMPPEGEDEGVAVFDEANMQSFSVVTVIPGRDGMQEQKVTVLDQREEVQKKLEQVILALGEKGEIVTNGTGDDEDVAEHLQTTTIGELLTLASKSLPMVQEGETIVIVPEVQAETEICTTEMVGTVLNDNMGEVGALEVDEGPDADQSGRMVSEEDMAAATWLHNMQNVQSVTVETIVHEVSNAS